PALVFAYDDAAVPYFLMMNGAAAADYRVEPRDCALVSIRNNDPPLMGPAELRWDECHHADTWTRVTGRRFHQAGRPREWPSPPGTPRAARREGGMPCFLGRRGLWYSTRLALALSTGRGARRIS